MRHFWESSLRGKQTLRFMDPLLDPAPFCCLKHDQHKLNFWQVTEIRYTSAGEEKARKTHCAVFRLPTSELVLYERQMILFKLSFY